jgi:hypothetical protein
VGQADTNLKAENNTSYLNDGSGFVIQDGPVVTFDRNVGAYNQGYGVESSDFFLPGCNDWYGNTAGAASGVNPGPTDLAVNPQFCNATGDDVHLVSTSPLVNAAGCGQVGALGVGCAASTGVVDAVESQDAMRVAPNPASGAMHFSWRPSLDPGRLEVLDLTGALRWSTTVEAQNGGVTWRLADASGRRVAPGVYWARLRRGGRSHVERVVVVP